MPLPKIAKQFEPTTWWGLNLRPLRPFQLEAADFCAGGDSGWIFVIFNDELAAFIIGNDIGEAFDRGR
ncbi:MAG: hypothetical protein BGO65_07670 [Afipia sp. 64-13]|nr:MAG: hypothetical protein BGO65_07670 [Afipia sp. 64-13]